MPDEYLTKRTHRGFYGKLPTAGDFVSRGLPGDFIQVWDRWAARNLVPPMVSGEWATETPLFFVGARGVPRPVAGVALPSQDRAGRLFPLTLAAEIGCADGLLALPSAEWFEDLRALGDRACAGEFDADGLGAALAALPAPETDAGGDPGAFYLGRRADELWEVDPDDPAPTLRALLDGAPAPCHTSATA